MAPKLPVVKARDLIRVLESLGYRKVGQRGSHAYYAKPGGRKIAVPLHGQRDIGRGLLRKILRDLGISREEFLKRLRR